MNPKDFDEQIEAGEVRKYRGQPITTGVLFTAGELVPLPLKKTAVRAAITAASAEVTVNQTFVNTHNRAVEAVYVFPLPEDAAVHRLRMHVGDRTIEGVVREKVEARKTYEQAKKEGHGAALLEESTPNIFTISVANILPEQEVRVEMAYLQPLPFQAGQYRFVFPMVVSPRYVLGTSETAEPIVTSVPEAVLAPRLPQGVIRGDMVSLEIDLDAGVPLGGFDSPSHDISILEEDGKSRVRIALRNEREIPNRDFVLNYRVAGPEIKNVLFYEPGEGDEPGTFALLATPPASPATPAPGWTALPSAPGAPVWAASPSEPGALATGQAASHALDQTGSHAREVIFVLDRSGSMDGKPLEEAKKALSQLLDRLSPQDSFNIIAFDDTVEVLAAAPLRAEEPALRRARAFVDGIDSRGGTEMLEPLRLALRQPAADVDAQSGRNIPRMRTVVFLTDGSVSGERELLGALRGAIGQSRIVGFGIGTAVNRHLMNKLTAAGRGFAEYIYPGENIARVVDRTLGRLSHPVLTDIELEWAAEGVELIHDRCPDLYRDQPLFIVGRYRGAQPPAVTIRGRLADRPYAAGIESTQARRHEGGVPLRVLLARQRIETLMDEIWEHPERKEELRRQVIELAIRFRLASEFTSFLAVEYRSAAEREKAMQAVTVEVPQYMPEGMANALCCMAAPAPSAIHQQRMLRSQSASPSSPTVDGAADAPRFARSAKSGGGIFEMLGKLLGRAKSSGPVRGTGGSGPMPAPTTAGLSDDPLQAKLDPVLRGLAERVAREGQNGNWAAGSAQLVNGYKVQVVIQLKDASRKTRKALKKFGFVQSQEGKSGAIWLLTGMLDVRKLETVAKLDAVVRVESAVK